MAVFIQLTACEGEPPSAFSDESMKEVVIDLKGEGVELGNILSSNSEEKTLIYVWASWCRDCIVGFPELREFQRKNKDINYVLLSLDRSIESWRAGINKYGIEGQHYYLKSGWDGPFGEFIDLDWIPRYLVVDENGMISKFKSIRIDDLELIKAFN